MRNSARPQSSRSRQPAGRRAGSRTAAATWACAAPAAWAALIFLVGLYIHLTYYPIGNVGVETDFYGGMAPAAQKLSAGDFSVTDYPYRGPFYSVVLVLVNLLVRDWYHSGVLLNLLCAAGSILLISRLHGRLYNRSVALATAVFTSLLYPFFIDAHKATSDHLFLFLALLSISLVIRDRAVAWRLFAGGVVCALAFLTRYNGVLLAFGAGIALLVVNPDRASWKRRLVWCGVFLLGFLIVSAPWFAKSLVETGQLLWTKNIKNITMAFYGASAGGDDPAKEFESLGDLIASDRGYFVSRLGRNLVDHLGNDLRYLIDRAGSILVLLGVVRLLLRAPTRRQWALYSFAGVYFTGMGLVFYLPRFFVFLAVTYYALAFCVLFGSGGGRETALGLRARQLWRARAARGIRRSITAIQGVPRFRVVCICIVLVLLGGMKLRAIIHLEQAYYLDRPLYVLPAAKALRVAKRAGDRPLMMARRPHLAFLAGMRFRRYPGEVACYEDLLRAAQDAGVDYLVYGRGELVEFPDLRFLAAYGSIPGLEIAYAGETIVVFRVPADLEIDRAVQEGEVLRLRFVIEEAVRSGDLCRDLANSVLLGKRYLDGGQTERAEKCLLAGLKRAGSEVHPNDVTRMVCMLRYNLGVIWIKQARYDEARELLERSCAEPSAEGALQEVAMSRYLLGYMDENLKRLEAALGHYEHARRDFLRAGDKAMAQQAAAHVDQLRRRLGKGEK